MLALILKIDTMLKNYFKTSFRSPTKNKMAVTLLIGLWINDELSFDKYHRDYNRIAQVMQNQTFSGEVGTQPTIPMPLGNELRNTYGSEFKKVVMSTGTESTYWHRPIINS
jgi:putative ABC transport system permease protein